ncbi:MAG: putative porin [Betaproteobacteria bacterium]
MVLAPKRKLWRTLPLALCATALMGLSTTSALADSEILDELLEKLKDKGVLSEDEYQALKKAREEERLEQRADRRRQAVKAAQESEKDEKAKTATKFDVNPGIKSMQLYGDVRLRFESRDGYSPSPSGLGVTGTNDVGRERWRYAARIGLRGDLTDDWFYGVRLDTGTNNRSTWVTFGGDTNFSTNGQGPSAKNDDGVQIGQIYLGWRAQEWLTLQAGKMPNPFYTTAMVWDPDIQPEGFAEKFTYKIGDSLELFGNFAQMVYQDVNPDQTRGVDLGFHKKDAFMLGWQGGATYKFTPDMNVKGALTYYNYVGLGNSTPFTGDGPPPAAATAAYFNGQNGINDLRVVEVPLEFNFPLWGRNARVFGDFAKNLDGHDRARAAGHAGVSEDKAFQFGVAYGTLGLVTGATSKKGAWEVRTYYQRIEQFALDPNLIDSDFFEGRTNLKGVYVAGAYGLTDSMIGTLRYGYAQRINHTLGTGGSNPDLPYLNPIDDYRLIQFDLTWKF